MVTGWGSPNGQSLINALVADLAEGFATGWVAISGPTLYPDCLGDTSTSIAVDGFEVEETYTYGESSETMALDLASDFSASGSPVSAVASG